MKVENPNWSAVVGLSSAMSAARMPMSSTWKALLTAEIIKALDRDRLTVRVIIQIERST